MNFDLLLMKLNFTDIISLLNRVNFLQWSMKTVSFVSGRTVLKTLLIFSVIDLRYSAGII